MKKWKCTICNYIHEGDEPPEECPICGADSSFFVEVTDDESAEPIPQDSATEKVEEAATQLRRWKCSICNYIHDGDEPPEICPVCGADKSVFIEIGVEEETAASIVELEETTQPDIAESAEPPVQQSDTALDKPQPFGLIGKLVMKFHLHAISVHTPNGVIPVAIVFLVLAMFFTISSLELASFFNRIFVLLSMPAVILTGIISWQIKYKGAKTWVFKTKLACSFVVLILITLMVVWRFIDQSIAMSGGTSSLVYLALGGIILAAAGIAGHLGGTLVHGK